MATTKIWKVQKRIDNVINYAADEEKTKSNLEEDKMKNFNSVRQTLLYITNAEKTEKQFYTTGINCHVEKAVREMNIVKSFYEKESGILAFHAYQSFNEGEVIPKIAHEIGVKLANEMWGDRFQVVVSTHLNTKHLHNHFVINSVSFKDGKKYYSNFENTALLRKTSDEICEEYGLKVLKEKPCKSGVNFENFYKKSMRDSDYYKFAKEDLDYAIKHSYTWSDFEEELSGMGYYYEYRGEKLSIRREPNKRNIRVERAFGDNYSIDSIKRRILENMSIDYKEVVYYKTYKDKTFTSKNKIKRLYKPKGIVALYYYYRYLLNVYRKQNMEHKLTPEMRAELKKLAQYSERVRFVCKYKIETTSDIFDVKEKKEKEAQKVLNTRNRLYYKRQGLGNESDKEVVTKEIIAVTKELKKVRKEIKLCDDVYDNVTRVKKQLKEMEERGKDKVREEEEKKMKKKKDRGAR